MRSKALILAAGLSAAVALSGSAQATVVPIPGTGSSGFSFSSNSGTGAFGNAWTWSTTLGPASADSPGAGYSVWGMPGLGLLTVPYKDDTPATDFEITFVPFVSASINFTPSPFSGGYNEFTRFDSCNSSGGDCVDWTTVAVNSLAVSFFAPPGTQLTAGDDFFVNVVFNQTDVSGFNSGFLAVFTTNVPELPTWAMFGIGFAGIGLVGLSRRGKGSRYAF
jgi:hypothetical protein